MIRWGAMILLSLMCSATQAAQCKDITYRDISYAICTVDASEDLRLFLYDDDDAILGHFSAINRALREEGKKLDFAMNAGMYHKDRSPVGHYVENGKQSMRVIPNAGPGNFGLLPNGILCLRPGYGQVIETQRFLNEAPKCTYATQSGPMLVIDGELHPRFFT